MFSGRLTQIVILSIGVTIQFPTLCYAVKPEAEHFKYVSDAVNQIVYLEAKSRSPKDNAKEIVDEACKMLTQLVSDQEFSELVRKGFSGTLTPEQRKLLQNLGAINDVVIKEEAAFENVGINHLSSIQALAAAIPLVKTFNSEKVNAEAILNDIATLQEKSCTLTSEIEDSEKWERKKHAVVLGVSGVAFVLANGASQYYSWGLLTLVVNFSYTVGAGLVVQSLHDLSTI